MEIQEIRRKRLAQLISERYESQADFVSRTGINQGEVSALLKSKSFGEKKARKIEEDSGLPVRWLDTIDGGAPTAAVIASPPVAAPPRPRLQWVYDDEAEILSDYRRMANAEKQSFRSAAKAMPKKVSTRFASDDAE